MNQINLLVRDVQIVRERPSVRIYSTAIEVE
jgi:hypothetical protein